MAKGSYKLVLFISGMSVKSVHAIENLKAICDKHLQKNFTLDIIDLSKEKEKAQEYGIFAIPTLIKFEPGTKRTIIGDLSNTDKVLKALGITS